MRRLNKSITASFNNTDPYDYSSSTDQLFDDLKDYAETKLPVYVDLTEQMADFTDKCEQTFTRYVNISAFSRVAYLSRTYGFILQILQWILAAVALILPMLLFRFSPCGTIGFVIWSTLSARWFF